MLRLGVTSEPYPFGFGTALVAAGGQHLPIRRICRLRWVDAMALLQRASNKASRIGLAPELDPTVSTEKVALFSGNRQIGTIEARVTSVGDAKPTRVDVESAELRTQVRGRAEFANLAKLSAEYPGHFNILAAKPEYAISPATGDPRLWKVRAPAPGSRQPPQDRERSVPTEDGPS